MRDQLVRYLIEQGKQPSTWRGGILLVSALWGFNVPEDRTVAIITLGMLAAGAVGLFFPDNIARKDGP